MKQTKDMDGRANRKWIETLALSAISLGSVACAHPTQITQFGAISLKDIEVNAQLSG